ncbi:MAG: thioredoxin domain-containing protein [Verrucomicrobiaceae bacterium]|nr:MAG: thioredoxin domain-containing protein [Verrucomicrobiaceae bacterium]
MMFVPPWSLIMKNRSPFPRPLATMALCLLVLASGACRKERVEDAKEAAPVTVVAPELLTNQLGTLPGAIYRNQALSPIHWQPWTKPTLERARAAGRLLFCVVAMPQQPGYQQVLASLAADMSLVREINDTYVPVLVDGDASREMSIITADLCAEIKRPLNLPMFLWMTHEGNPVAWMPVPGAEPEAVRELFSQSHSMVTRMWQDDPEYVLKNSALDNEARRSRILQRKVTKMMSEQPAVDALLGLRQLAALYDPYSRSFDETGGLFPSSALELLSSASVHPGLPAEVRERCHATLRDLLVDLIPSAMFDPLEGGVFSSRRSVSWALPAFIRDCQAQGRVAVALLEASRATGNARALDKALELIAYAEKAHATPEGLFAAGLMQENDPEQWMWSVEEVTRILGPEDAEWWIKATGMKGLGNLPSEVDPRREFFRANTLGMTMTPAEIAAGLAQPLESFMPRFEAAKAKLLAVRNQRFEKSQRDECPHAPSTFRMVSAYAAAFSATGDEAYRQKATSLLQRAREAFAVGPRLRVFATDAPESIGAGRAFLYALAMQAILDVAAITSDDQWLLWSEDLATTSAELFTGNEFLKECPDDAALLDIPVTDLVMLFDDSTAGLVSLAECRLAEIGRPLVASFSQLVTPLPTYTLDRPVLHTDLLLATVARHYKVTVVYGADLTPEMKLAVERLPLRVVQRRAAGAADQVPAGSVKILLGEKEESRLATTPDALKEALLPSPGNS